MSGTRKLGRREIEGLLRELGEELAAHGHRAELFVVGGAALTLAYDMRRMTADVDGVFEPKQVVYDAARRVAARHPGLSSDWLNDGVKGFLLGEDPRARVALDAPGLSVRAASPEYLLALKVQAARQERDSDDIQALARMVGARTADDVLAIAERVIGRDRLAPKAQYIVQAMFPTNADAAAITPTSVPATAESLAGRCGSTATRTGAPCRRRVAHRPCPFHGR